jgi:hypothetical protein
MPAERAIDDDFVVMEPVATTEAIAWSVPQRRSYDHNVIDGNREPKRPKYGD